MLLLCRSLILFFVISNLSFAQDTSNKIDFWKSQKRGANIFNHKVSPEIIKIAKSYGIEFIRLAPDKFKSQQKDFLIGNADDYQRLVQSDLQNLKNILDEFHKEKLPVVLVFLSLPGSRWKQNNNNKDDLRLWDNELYIEQSERFLYDVTKAFSKHPAIVGLNILNEPHLDIINTNMTSCLNDSEIQQKLNIFYNRIIKNIRKIDDKIPVIIESSNYSDPKCFTNFLPIKDKYIIYSFHMYEPFSYTNKKINKGNYEYPGKIVSSETNSSKLWNKSELENYLIPISIFQKKYHIPNWKILAGEFGGHRTTRGLDIYFKDLISIFDKKQWHWAVYAFREDTWDGMDYEIGNMKLPLNYWHTIERGENPIISYQPNNKIFEILRNGWIKTPQN
ncbi:MAG: glycosyl hydrolase [Francisellaceae bacterium]|nr:glycosyl hydrolase [Francisellaceae bacterium]